MPSQDDYNKAFWHAYFDVVRDTYEASDSTAIFFASKGQLGPPAGSGIDQKYTNAGIFQIADNLLTADSLSYTQAQGTSYSRALLNFLDYVDLGINWTPNDDAFIKQCAADLAAAKKAAGKAEDDAYAQYDKAMKRGMADPGTTFPQWVVGNAPDYTSAVLDVTAASGKLEQANMKVQGPKTAGWKNDRDRVWAAIYGATLVPGTNMEVCTVDPATAAELRRAQQTGDAVPAPKTTAYRPDYSLPGYSTMINNFIQATHNSNPQYQSATINFDKGTKVDTSHLNKWSAGANVSIPTPWFSINAGGSASHEDSSGLKSTDQQQTSITVKWLERVPISIQAGNWDVGAQNYTLKKDAPASVRGLVRPTQLICYNMLCFDITFQGESIKEVDQAVTDTKSGSAGISIFGWNIGFGGSGSSTTTDTSHTATWDKQSGTLSLKPQESGLNANFAAIIGQKQEMASATVPK